jgi:tripartite-type tricarboxylate transporter receptor subunit TctC
MFRRAFLGAVAVSAVSLSCFAPVSSYAQSAGWPSKPIKFIVPYPPGGTTDMMSRYLTTQLQIALGQPIVVENLGGMAGGIGSARLAQSAPDGYTLGLAFNGSHAIIPHIYSTLKYDPLKDFTPVARFFSYANVIVVNAQSPYKTLAELIKAAKAKPDTITFSSPGSGSMGHLSAEMIGSMAGVKFTHIPYKGAAAAMTDLLGGRVDFMADVLLTSQPFMTSGKLRALAVTSPKRLPGEPNLPTVAETLPGYEATGWGSVAGPAGLPRDIVDRLNAEIKKILNKPETAEYFSARGFDVAYSTPEALSELMRKDLAMWKQVVISSGAKVD